MNKILPKIDRDKLGKFLHTTRMKNSMKNDKWLPRDRMNKSQIAVDDFIHDLIGRIVGGEFDD